MAELLFQVAHVRAGTVSGARFVHPVDETEKHAALDDGRGPDHAPGRGILRLRRQTKHRRQRSTARDSTAILAGKAPREEGAGAPVLFVTVETVTHKAFCRG